MTLVLFATGSTGGHVTPALAVAEALRELDASMRPLFCGPLGGVAERMVAEAGESYVPLDIHPLRGAGVRRLVRGVCDLPAGAVRSWRLLSALRPDVVVGTGAHTSGPLVALAALRGISTLLFEANVDVGLANQLLGRLVHGAAVAWPQTLGAFPGRGFLSGWPVRRTIRESSARTPSKAERFHLLILGGSAGAPDLDRAMRDALPHLGGVARSLSVMHQASAPEVASLREHYRAAGVAARVDPFVADIAREYAQAALVVTRAGGATLAELAAAGLPAILVPLPAAGDHQQANARAWEAAGCARCVLPSELEGPKLAAAILGMVEDRAALHRMGAAARAWHRPEAAALLADWCRRAMRRT